MSDIVDTITLSDDPDDDEIIAVPSDPVMMVTVETPTPMAEESDKFSRLINCSGCGSSLSSVQSHILHCLHILCQSCLDANVKRECPACKQSFAFAEQNVQKNILAEVINQLAAAQQSDTKLCACGDPDPVTSVCLMCKEYLCEACVRAHKRVKITKDHVVKKIGEEGTDCVALAVMRCSTHPIEEVVYFCDTCAILTCRDCQLSDVHHDHSKREVKEVVSLETLRDLQRESEKSLEQIRIYSVQFDGTIGQIASRRDELLNKVSEEIEAAVKELKTREAAVRQIVSDAFDVRSEEIKRRQTTCNDIIPSVVQAMDLAAAVIDSGSDATILYSTRAIQEQREMVGAVLRGCSDVPYVYSGQDSVEVICPTKKKFLTDIQRFIDVTADGRSVMEEIPNEVTVERNDFASQINGVSPVKEVGAQTMKLSVGESETQTDSTPSNQFPAAAIYSSPTKTLVSAPEILTYNPAVDDILAQFARSSDEFATRTASPATVEETVSRVASNPELFVPISTTVQPGPSRKRNKRPVDPLSAPPSLGGQFNHQPGESVASAASKKPRTSTSSEPSLAPGQREYLAASFIHMSEQQNPMKQKENMRMEQNMQMAALRQQRADQMQQPFQPSQYQQQQQTTHPYQQYAGQQMVTMASHAPMPTAFRGTTYPSPHQQMYRPQDFVTLPPHYPRMAPGELHMAAMQFQQRPQMIQQSNFTTMSHQPAVQYQPQQIRMQQSQMPPVRHQIIPAQGSPQMQLQRAIEVAQQQHSPSVPTPPLQPTVPIPQQQSVAKGQQQQSVAPRSDVPPQPISTTKPKLANVPSKDSGAVSGQKRQIVSKPASNPAKRMAVAAVLDQPGNTELQRDPPANSPTVTSSMEVDSQHVKDNGGTTDPISSKISPSSTPADQSRPRVDQTAEARICAMCTEPNYDEVAKCSKCLRVFHYQCHIPVLGPQEVILNPWTCTICTTVEMGDLDEVFEDEIAPLNDNSPWERSVCNKVFMEILCSPHAKSDAVGRILSMDGPSDAVNLKMIRRRLLETRGCFTYGNIVQFLDDMNEVFQFWFKSALNSPDAREVLKALLGVYKTSVEHHARPQYVATVMHVPEN